MRLSRPFKQVFFSFILLVVSGGIGIVGYYRNDIAPPEDSDLLPAAPAALDNENAWAEIAEIGRLYESGRYPKILESAQKERRGGNRISASTMAGLRETFAPLRSLAESACKKDVCARPLSSPEYEWMRVRACLGLQGYLSIESWEAFDRADYGHVLANIKLSREFARHLASSGDSCFGAFHPAIFADSHSLEMATKIIRNAPPQIGKQALDLITGTTIGTDSDVAKSLRSSYYRASGIVQEVLNGNEDACREISSTSSLPSLKERFLFLPNRTQARLASGFRAMIHSVEDGDPFSHFDFDRWLSSLPATNHIHRSIPERNETGNRFSLESLPGYYGDLDHLVNGRSFREAVISIDALRRFESDHGQLPDTLAELVPKYLDALPVDHFDGKPLRYSKSNRCVFSIGGDGLINRDTKKEDFFADRFQPTLQIDPPDLEGTRMQKTSIPPASED